MSNKHLLTLDDLYNFYSTKKKSMNFDCNKSGYNVVVQTNAKLILFEEDLSEGLLYAKARAFHDLTNNNKSHIKTDVFKEKVKSLKDRPVMADIVDTGKVDDDGNPIKDFSGHSMYYDETKEKFVYMEIPVGHFVNPEDIKVEYDEEYDRNFAIADVVIYEEYTEACEIIRRRQSVDCSVELVIRSMSWNNADKVLVLNDFYVQGCTLLGENVKPGMSGSKIQLKDFSEQNNSIFSSIDEKTNEKLIETLDRLNNTLSGLNIDKKINNREEVEPIVNDEIKLNEEVIEVIQNESEDTTGEVVEASELNDGVNEVETESESEVVKEESEDVIETNETDPDEDDETDDTNVDDDPEETDDTDADQDDPDDDEDDEDDVIETAETDVFTASFELSHDDIRRSLYALLEPYNEANNDWYWICEVYDEYFVYQGIMGEYHGQKYSVDGDTVQFTGNPYALYAEFLTQSEREALEEMRSNYSAVNEELSKYKRHEDYIHKMSLFDNDEYSKYLDTDEFKSLMSEDTLISLTESEIIEKADAIIGKFMRMKKFTLNEEPKAPMFAFSHNNTTECSFLDGLLKKK